VHDTIKIAMTRCSMVQPRSSLDLNAMSTYERIHSRGILFGYDLEPPSPAEHWHVRLPFRLCFSARVQPNRFKIAERRLSCGPINLPQVDAVGSRYK